MKPESTVSRPRPRGRPVVTTHAQIEQAAFRLFADRGFDGTTLEDIAQAVGVGRRTIFRYYNSKNDIPWGRFDLTLEGFRQIFAEFSDDLPVYQAVRLAVGRFNEFPRDAQPDHRERMRLILQTPTLQAHSVLRYAQWRAVIAEYVARRLDVSTDSLLPGMVGHVSLGLALSAYDTWLQDVHSDLPTLIDQAFDALQDFAFLRLA